MKINSFPISLLTVALALGGSPATVSAVTVVIDNFEAGEGHFASIPTASGSVRRVLASSTADQAFTEFFQGSASQRLIINRNPDTAAPAPTAPAGPGEWFLRHLSGGGSIANNDPIPNNGTTWVGYWVKTTSSNLKAGIILDDDLVGGANNHQISVFQDVVADGAWHLYQFELASASNWNLFAGAQANPTAINDATVTIDSLAFLGATGVADTATFFVDNVTYSTDGPIQVPEPAALPFAALGSLALVRRRR